MIHKSKSENPSLEENENSWLGSNLYRLMLVVTVVWFAIVLIYITQFFGWSNLFLMMPDEFGGSGRGNSAAGADLGRHGLCGSQRGL